MRNCRTRFVFLKSLKVFLVVLGMFGLKITFIKHDISRRFFMEIIKLTEILKKLKTGKEPSIKLVQNTYGYVSRSVRLYVWAWEYMLCILA